MFDFVAKHKRLLQVFLVVAIIPFAFFGLESYTNTLTSSNDIAVVDGVSISTREFSEELRRQQDRMRQVLGDQADASILDTPEMRSAILDALISQQLVLNEIMSAKQVLPRDQVVASILAAPEFQDGGKFSSERYMGYLRNRGMSDEANVAKLRVELPASRLAGAISGSAFQPRAVAERIAQLEGQKREVQEALISSDQFLGQVKIDAAAVKTYYDANAAEFRVPDQIRAEYLVLSADALGKAEKVTDEELKSAYEARSKQVGAAEERRASHILVQTQEEADKLVAELKKSPQRFAELAKKQSIDTGSAEQGGDLGQVAPGSLASKPLEEAVFKLKEGEIGGPVQTEFGFHVLRVTAVKAAKVKSFDELKGELSAELQKQKGAKKLGESADPFNNLVYEQSDSLKPAAERYKLQIQSTGWFTRQQPSPDIGPLAHPKLLAALFSSDSLQQKRNTDAVEVVPGILVAARVAEHRPASQRPLAEVQAQIEKTLLRREAAKLAQKEGAAKLEALNKAGGDAGLKWSAAKAISRREPQGVPPPAVSKVMTADATKLPVHVGAERGDDGYALYRVTKVSAPETKQAQDSKARLAQLDQLAGGQQLDAYVASLRARAKVEINQKNLEKR
jgi:peptidyl-prolyl cis-trans isomerase D